MTFFVPSTSPVFDEKYIQESVPPLEMHPTNPVVSSAEFVLEVSFHIDVVRVKLILINDTPANKYRQNQRRCGQKSHTIRQFNLSYNSRASRI